jgi:hypothetical protein
MYVQFVGLALLAGLVRRRPWKEIGIPLLLSSIALLAFIAVNLDSFLYRLLHGPNNEVIARSYAGLELYALKPLELLLPVVHRLPALENWVRQAYMRQAALLGEPASVYLGVVAICGVLGITWMTFKGVATNRKETIPREFWFIAWILLYSVVGGINGLIGVWGMVLFRGTNRYSIVIMALALLFLAQQLSRRMRNRHPLWTGLLSAAILAVGLADQFRTPPSTTEILRVRADVLADKKFAGEMESKLPNGSMVFELPVWDYPEAPEVNQMTDYEHFRPYLYTQTLRYSYGSDKGRARERWQREAEQMGPQGLKIILERYGFAAVVVNRKAYADHGTSLIEGLKPSGGAEVIAESFDLVCVRLNPSSHPSLPPEFDSNWYPLEGNLASNLRWSPGNATIAFQNKGTAPKNIRISFGLTATQPQQIKISSANAEVFNMRLEPHSSPVPVDLTLAVPPGGAALRFETDAPGAFAGNGDPRKLAFNVRDFTVAE